ncbi:hypothetical protein ACP4OV_018075 [Aristida adscensionis]
MVTVVTLQPRYLPLGSGGAGGMPSAVMCTASRNKLLAVQQHLLSVQESGLPCDSSLLPSDASSILKTKRFICLKNTHRLKMPCVCHGAGHSSENVIINGRANPSNAIQANSVAFGAIAADMAPDVALDPDHPTDGFSSIPEAIEDIRQGKCIIVVDDEDRENEGDLIMAASKVTPEAMAFIVRHSTGIVCVSMKEDDLERLKLPQMVPTKENEEKLQVAFAISVDAKEGTTTGVSAKDRTKTILALASADSKPEDFNRPGHIFPLMYRKGGVLRRPGHTESSLDLVMLAGLPPAAVLCEIVDDDDGSMALLPKLQEFARRENLKIITIEDLISRIHEEEKTGVILKQNCQRGSMLMGPGWWLIS